MAASCLQRLLLQVRRILNTVKELWTLLLQTFSSARSTRAWLRIRLTSNEDEESKVPLPGPRRHLENSRHRWRVFLLASLAIVTVIEFFSLASSTGGNDRGRHRKRSFVSNPFGRSRRHHSRDRLRHGLAGSLSPEGLTSHYQTSNEGTATTQTALPLAASGLTADDRKLLAGVLGFGNFSSFVDVDSAGVQKLAAAAAAYQAASTPCLWSQLLQRNVYLIPGGW